ncbi:MAPEG domain-containing protein [Rhizobium etli 8C-3]|uniref:MAPEG family protein n=2 Tax=Rhizobium TaxID=379 RepID=A0A4R3RN12_9HYPH|nr:MULTISPECIES: MAPEG family protein [Rhizobium]APO73700.1 MAPEG domain-containing protein [Rhizobium etli 8C-3]TCU27956.1 hypothetical protein EV130_103361 [Rhizobium azibense]TCU37258.1 hypothetical protein EV129_106221 [Rhizobium azibense]
MTGTEIFWPIIAHVALVYGLYMLLSLRRRKAVEVGNVNLSDFRENRSEPPESLFVKNSIANQFELPVLFYVCCILLYITEADNIAALVLAWIFVALRYAHAFVHVTSNRMRFRSPLFAAGYVVLGAMWAWLAGWVAFSG